MPTQISSLTLEKLINDRWEPDSAKILLDVIQERVNNNLRLDSDLIKKEAIQKLQADGKEPILKEKSPNLVPMGIPIIIFG
jgi:hypothetical protein